MSSSLLAPPCAAADEPAYLCRRNLQLCFVTRRQVKLLAPLELACLEAATDGKGTLPPSALRGAFVRFVSKGAYRIARIAATRRGADGGLELELHGFERPVPSVCLSNSNTLDDSGLWQPHGQREVAALARSLKACMPTRREVGCIGVECCLACGEPCAAPLLCSSVVMLV